MREDLDKMGLCILPVCQQGLGFGAASVPHMLLHHAAHQANILRFKLAWSAGGQLLASAVTPMRFT